MRMRGGGVRVWARGDGAGEREEAHGGGKGVGSR